MPERSMFFDKTARNIDKTIAKYPDLEEVTVDAENPDYVSKDGLLFKKDGKKMIACPKGRTECRVPDGTTFIRNLQDCKKLKKLYIPKTVTDIGKGFFLGCDALEEITVEGAKLKFKAEHFGKSGIPEKLMPGIADLAKNLSPDAFSAFVLDNGAWKSIPAETVVKLYLSLNGKAMESHFDPVVRTIGEDVFAGLIARSLQTAPSKKNAESAAKFLVRYGAKINKRNRSLLDDLVAGKETRLTKEESDALDIMAGRTTSLSPLEQAVMGHMTADGLNTKDLEKRLKDCFGLTYKDLPEIKDLQGNPAPSYMLAWLLTAHESDEYYRKPGVRPEAAEVLSLLDRVSFNDALTSLADTYLQQYQNKKMKYLTHPFCRYADEKMMAELTKRAPRWRTTTSGDRASPLNELRIYARYSNTRAAMLFADRYHELGEYAKMRGMTEDDIRDRYLSETGLDADGGKSYDLGNQTVTARLQKDLSFLIVLPDGKTAKSLPKKGADPERYGAANADFSDMKKSVKRILSNRGKALFEDFLSGRSRKADEWKAAYLENPVLRIAASLVVWSQGKKTFTIRDGEPADSAGTPYTIEDSPVKVAHPMEMDDEDTRRWQIYFTSRGLKQPFEQIWEPVRVPENIRPDRYEGCTVPIVYFSGKDKHGIHAYGMNMYSGGYGFYLAHCDLEFETDGDQLGYDWASSDNTFKLGKFTFKKYTRQVNHIVTILDRMTLFGRIRKDDVSVMSMMDSFTLAQIMDFIRIAQEAGANNVLMQLMEYKNDHFADYDPMDELTLDW